MKIVNYFDYEHKDKILFTLESSGSLWGAIPFLCKLLKEDSFHKTLGKGHLLLLLDEDNLSDGLPALQGFATLCEKDEVVAPELFPWLGFVFVFPECRGKRLSGLLIEHALNLTKELYPSAKYLYVSTDHIGLYERFGFDYFAETESVWGKKARLYRKAILL